MARVMNVDSELIARTRSWLLTQRQTDGSWRPDSAYQHRDTWSGIQNSSLPVTAYVIWALGRTGNTSDLGPSIRWLEAHADEASDPYVRAMVTLALSVAAPESPRAKAMRAGLARAAAPVVPVPRALVLHARRPARARGLVLLGLDP